MACQCVHAINPLANNRLENAQVQDKFDFHQSSMLAQAHMCTSGESIVPAVLVFLPFTVLVVTNNITGVHVNCIRSNSRKLGWWGEYLQIN